jgi:hypothetical protein
MSQPDIGSNLPLCWIFCFYFAFRSRHSGHLYKILFCMEQVLDNPIWNALVSGNKSLSLGTDKVKYFAGDVAPFIGMAAYRPENMQDLLRDAPVGRKIVIFSDSEVDFPTGLTVHEYISTYQMVYERDQVPELTSPSDSFLMRTLSESDVPAMLELTEQTRPGPFFQHTIDFGHYEGIFEGKRLVSMPFARRRRYQGRVMPEGFLPVGLHGF